VIFRSGDLAISKTLASGDLAIGGRPSDPAIFGAGGQISRCKRSEIAQSFDRRSPDASALEIARSPDHPMHVTPAGRRREYP
jgi:hypothetical protein